MPVDLLLSSAASFSVAGITLGAALLVLHRRYRRSFMRAWAWGWICGGVASIGTAVTVAGRGSGAALTTLAAFLLVEGLMLQAVLQWWGARAFRSVSPRPPLPLRGLLLSCTVLAAAGVLASIDAAAPVRLVFRVAVPYGLLGSAFLYSAAIVRQRSEPGGRSFHLLPVVMGVYGLQKVIGAIVGGGIMDLPGDIMFLFTDLLFLSFVAFALPAWFLEEERAQTSRSERKQRELEQGLFEAQKLTALGGMAAGVAHDFNNLLTVIGGHAELLIEEADGERTEELAEIAGAQKRGSNLVRRLLAFARRQDLKSERVDPVRVLDDVAGLLAPLFGDAIALDSRCVGNPFDIEVDRAQLEQALVNLGTNARDAMPGGGEVVLELRGQETTRAFDVGGTSVPPGRWTSFSVSDSGTGMSPAIMARAFEPFFTTKARERGTGLGLATAFGFVEQSHGRLTVESEEGVGSTFTIFLPAAD